MSRDVYKCVYNKVNYYKNVRQLNDKMIFVWCVLFACCVLLYNHCHRVETHLQLK
jgi:hypothetical protein